MSASTDNSEQAKEMRGVRNVQLRLVHLINSNATEQRLMENASSAKIAKKENKGQEDALEAQTESAVTNHSHKLYSQQQASSHSQSR